MASSAAAAANMASFEKEATTFLRKRGFLLFGMNGLSLMKLTDPKKGDVEAKEVSATTKLLKSMKDSMDALNATLGKNAEGGRVKQVKEKGRGGDTANETNKKILDHLQRVRPVVSPSEERAATKRSYEISKLFTKHLKREELTGTGQAQQNQTQAATEDKQRDARKDETFKRTSLDWYEKIFKSLEGIRAGKKGLGLGGLLSGGLGLLGIVGGGLMSFFGKIFGGKGLLSGMVSGLFRGGVGGAIVGAIKWTLIDLPLKLFRTQIFGQVMRGLGRVLLGPVGLAALVFTFFYTITDYIIDKYFPKFKEKVGNAIGAAIEFVKRMTAELIQWVSERIEAVVNFLSMAKEKVGNFIGGTIDSIINMFKSVGEYWSSVIGDKLDPIFQFIDNLFTGVTDAFEKVKTFADDFATGYVDYLKDKVKSFFGIEDDEEPKPAPAKPKAPVATAKPEPTAKPGQPQKQDEAKPIPPQKAQPTTREPGSFATKDEYAQFLQSEVSAGRLTQQSANKRLEQYDTQRATYLAQTKGPAPTDTEAATTARMVPTSPAPANARPMEAPVQALEAEARAARTVNRPPAPEPKPEKENKKGGSGGGAPIGGSTGSKSTPLVTNNLGLLIIQQGDF